MVSVPSHRLVARSASLPSVDLTGGVRTGVVLLITAAIFLPFIPIAGPLSADDVLPLAGVGLAGFFLVFSRQRLPLDLTFFGFMLLAVTGLVSAGANALDLGDFGRLAGRASGRTLFYLGLVVALRPLLRDEDGASKALRLFAIAATAEAIFCVYAYFTLYRGPYGIGLAEIPGWSVLKVRVHGTFSGELKPHEHTSVSANFLASYLVLSVPVSGALALAAKRIPAKLAWLGAAALQVVALYMTYTRAALGALALGGLAMGFLLGKRLVSSALVVLALAGALALPTMREKITSEGNNRASLWSAAVTMAAKNPFAGVGDGNYMRVLSSDSEIKETPYGVANSTAHNSILLTAAHQGVPGALAHAILYGLLVVAAFAAFSRTRGRSRILAAGILGALIGFLVQDQFNNLAYVPKVATQMWFLFAVLPMLAIHGARSGEAGAALANSRAKRAS